MLFITLWKLINELSNIPNLKLEMNREQTIDVLMSDNIKMTLMKTERRSSNETLEIKFKILPHFSNNL